MEQSKELELSPEQQKGLAKIVEQLKNTVSAKWQSARSTLSRAEDRAEFLAKQFGPESKQYRENEENIKAYQRAVDEEKAKMDAELGTGPGKVLGFGGTGTHQPGATPVANTASQLSRLIQAHTPGLNIVSGAKQGLQSLLLPTSKSPEHLHAAEQLGSKLGAMNRRAEATAFQLRG